MIKDEMKGNLFAFNRAYIPEELSYLFDTIESRDKMTWLLLTQNEEGVVLASDTWNTNGKYRKVHKIAFNKDAGMIIGHAGNNSAINRDTGKITWIVDIMQSVCNRYNGYNFEECYGRLYYATMEFIGDIRLHQIGDVSLAQFFVVAFRKDTGSIEVRKCYYDNILKYDEEKFKTYTKPYHKTLVPQKDYNNNCSAFGVDCKIFNGRHLITDFSGESLLRIKEWTINNVEEKITQQLDLPEFNRTIGGSVEWVMMDKEGNITTNME